MGTLYVVATPIGNLGDMTPRAVEVLKSVSMIAAEDTRHTGRLLRAFEIDTPMVSYHHHNRAQRLGLLLGHLAAGDVALVSDAGTPAIADPGHELVAVASESGHTIVPVPGASSAAAAVSASGLVAGPFVFVGFLARSGAERQATLGKAITTGWPIVLFESPNRVVQTLREIEEMAPGRQGAIGREMTKLHEEFLRGPIPDLAETLEAGTPRGEFVVIVGEPGAQTDGQPDDGEQIARAILARGVKPSRAAREVAAILGIDSAAAYDLVQRVSREDATGRL